MIWVSEKKKLYDMIVHGFIPHNQKPNDPARKGQSTLLSCLGHAQRGLLGWALGCVLMVDTKEGVGRSTFFSNKPALFFNSKRCLHVKTVLFSACISGQRLKIRRFVVFNFQ
jgi:hypothetical protein